MHPRETAARAGTRPAIIMEPSGRRVTFAQLNEAANRAAHLLRSLGLEPGDHIALCLENHHRYFEICWAAHDAGLYYTPISSRLRASEVAYIVRDCGAKALIMSAALAEIAAALPDEITARIPCYMLDGALKPFLPYEEAVAAMPVTPLPDGMQGAPMVYSSGTTGTPKGVKPLLPGLPVDQPAPLPAKLVELYGFDAQTVYLSPAPLYHAAPLKFNMAVLARGGTSVILEKFDAELALRCIEEHGVTHSQWVPTMFIRMLRLPAEVRARYDLATHRLAIHAAAPCPVAVKQDMLDWWGPVIHEYYSGSESIGMCAIGPQEWLRHRGSVGRAVRGEIHIVDEQGRELPPGETGLVYFGGAGNLRYHNDPEKTARAHNERGWATMGDIGHLDADGYLYLSDRRDYVIISGGVNIYPQEAENLLSLHPQVADVAVFGVPNAEFGEEVKAVVVPRVPADAGETLAVTLMDYCRHHISSIKCPKTIEFAESLPREPTGKLLKKQLRARYWASPGTLAS